MVIWPPARYAVHSSAPFPLAAAAQIADVGDADGQWLGLPVAALSKPPDLSAVDMECSADSVGLVPYEQPVYVLANRLHEVLSRSVRYLEGRP